MKKICIRSFLSLLKLSSKTLLIMKVSILLIFVFTVNVSATLRSQDVKLDLSVKDKTLLEVIRLIEKQSDYRFFFSDNYQDLSNTVSLDVKGSSISEVLTNLLDNKAVTYKVLDNNIVVITPTEGNQQIVVTGTITDVQTQEPLAGVNILVEGTMTGTITDIEGKYSLNVPSPNSVLEFSFIGYVTEKVSVAGQSSINVTLVPDVTKLEEIVVIGYSSTQRKNLASSVSVVNAKDLKNLTTSDISQSLQGKMSGVQVTNSNGDPGSGAKIVIRGAGSFSSTEPLYVIDGIVGGDFKAISSQDIQSVSVLKDAATAAIYGSAAANGVLIITTKNGESGAMKVSYDGMYGISTIAKKMSMLNASQYVDLVEDIQKNNGSDLTSYLASPDARIDRTDWQDAVFRNAPVTEHSLRLAGGNKSVLYSFSTGLLSQKSIIIDSKFQRIHIGAKLSENLFKNRVKLGQSIRMKYDVTKGNTASFYDALYMPPYLPIYDESVLGGYARADKVRDLNDANNPFASVYLSPKTDRSLHTELDLNGEVTILNGLTFKSQARFTADNSHGQTFNYPVQAGNHTRLSANMSESFSYAYHLYLDNFLSFDRTFGAHNISFTAGNHYSPSGYYGFASLAGSDFSSDAIQNVGLADPKNKSITGLSVNSGRSRLSYFSRLGYTFKEKYVINASFRRDGSSTFGKNKRWGNFYGIGGAWNISKENFMTSIPAINDLKLRISYGKTGNDLIPMFLTSPTVWKGDNANLVYSLGDIDGTYYNGATIVSIPNPNLKWEESAQTDIGFDLSLFKNIKIVFDYFYRDNKDLLIQTNLPTSTGLGKPGATPSMIVNGASMKSKGVEMGITYNGQVNNFIWDINLNATYNTNEVYALGTIGNIPITYNETRTDIGHPLASFYGYKVDHVAIDQADVDNYNARAGNGATEYQAGLKPGDRIYQDVNGDSIINDKDRTYIGNPSPKWQYGMTVNCEYKGFDFQVMLQGLFGVDIANMNHGTFEGMARPFNSFSTVLDRWREPGDISTLPAAGQNPGTNLYFSDWFVEKGDYLRVKNIAVGYTIPSSVFKYGKLRVYVALQNILTFTKYTGYDPEVSASDNSEKGYIFTRGVDNMQHPNPKIYRVGLQLNF